MSDRFQTLPDGTTQRVFEPDGDTLHAFMADRKHLVKIIQGPEGCLSPDTEFLTPAGWKAIADYELGDKVGEWTPGTGELQFRAPLEFVDLPCEAMWHFHNQCSLSMMLSDEHRVPLYTKTGRFVVKQASALASAPGRHTVPVNFTPRTPGLKMTDAAIRLWVAITADGCLPKRSNQIIVTVRKDRKKERLRGLLIATGVEWNEYPHSTRPTETAFAFSRDGWGKGFGPEWWAATPEQLAIVVEECVLWDGTQANGEQRFSTTKKDEADFIQYAAHACGRRASISVYRDPRNETWSENYTVQITTPGSRKAKVMFRGDNVKIERVPAKRKYCFRTGTGFFLARHNGRIFVTGNSGTSSACCLHIYQMAMEQPEWNGRRRFRAFIFRETYAKLEDTTIPTWKHWFPPDQYGRFYETAPYRHEIRVGNVELDAHFVAIDKIADAEPFFKSLEPSVLWFNEGRFVDFKVIQHAVSRVSPPRFPPAADEGCAWGGLIIDTNAPPADHWIPIMRGDNPPPDWMTEDQRKALRKPKHWRFFMQPPGLIEECDSQGNVAGYRPNPKAENLRWLHKAGVDPMDPESNFYMLKVGAQSKQWIDANIMNRCTVVVDGQPVYPLFRRDAHVSATNLEPIPGLPVIVGLDFGRQPAALIGQNLRGDWYIQREFIGRDMSAAEFAPQLKNYLSQYYPGCEFVFWGDPSGGFRGQATDHTPFEVFRANNMIVRPAPVTQNRRSLRQEAVNNVLRRRSSTGSGNALTVDPRCTTYITGMDGGYYLRRMQVSGERYSEDAEKNSYSHICEAGEYLMVGGGEGRSVTMRGSEKPKPTNTRRAYNPFAREKRVSGW